MSHVIYKYLLLGLSQEVVELPEGAEILDIQLQPSQGEIALTLQLWAKVSTDPYALITKRTILMLATGQEYSIEAPTRYIITLQTPAGLVWHFFERLKDAAPQT